MAHLKQVMLSPAKKVTLKVPCRGYFSQAVMNSLNNTDLRMI